MASALASLHNTGKINRYLIFYNESSNSQLGVLTSFYGDDRNPVASDPLIGGPGPNPKDVPSGNIAAASALTAVEHGGLLNVYGVLNGKAADPEPGEVTGNEATKLLVCRLSPAFEFLNVSRPPLASPVSIAACSDGNNGVLFFLGRTKATSVKLYALDLPGTKYDPTPVSLSLAFNQKSYLGAAYGRLGDLVPQAYAVVQDDDGVLHLTSIDGQVNAPVSGNVLALPNTSIACAFLGNRLVVYYFGLVGSSTTGGSPVYRATTTEPAEGFHNVSLSSAMKPATATQITAFLDPSSVHGDLGTIHVSYVQDSTNGIITIKDQLTAKSIVGDE